jgi:hypothetical protein
MNRATKQWIERMLGGVAREIVRIGFTVFGVYIYMSHAPEKGAPCTSEVFGIQTNSMQIFALILIFGVGLGTALIMKLGSAWLTRKQGQ